VPPPRQVSGEATESDDSDDDSDDDGDHDSDREQGPRR
jgi:hypothetical protein